MSVLTAEDARSLADSVAAGVGRLWPHPRTAGEQAEWTPLWDRAVSDEWTSLGVADSLEGLVAAQAVLGRAACPLPLLDAFVAARLLADVPSFVAGVESGSIRPAVVPATVVRDGAAGPVEAGELATHVVVLGNRAVHVHAVAGITATPGLASPSWSTLDLGELVVEVADADTETALAVIRLGLAVRAFGAARSAHEIAVEHAKGRVQFGRPVGSFQLVQKRAVESLIDVTVHDLLLQSAVRDYRQNPDGFVLAAELVASHADMRAAEVQLAAQHTLAAIGYFEEHEAPWLFKRVHADLARMTDFAVAAGEVGDILLETDARPTAPGFGPEVEAFRAEVRAFIASTPFTPRGHASAPSEELVAALAARGYLAFTWPEEWGGRGGTLEQQVILTEELGYHRVPVARLRAAADIIGHALLQFGTPEQRDRFLPPIAAGRFPFYLGYSEPEVGSDLASLRTSATPDGDGWLINGTKMWGTGAHDAEFVWLAARTDPESATSGRPHRGITVFLIPTDRAGWSRTAHRALSGEVSCTTFFDDVRAEAGDVVGEVDGGWRIITGALANERAGMAGMTAGVRRSFDDLVDLLRSEEGSARRGTRGSAVRRTLTELAVRVQAARLLADAGARAAADDGDTARLFISMAKITAGELAEDFGECALRILGSRFALGVGADDAPAAGLFEYGLRESIVQVVGGGTGDIQRAVIARLMGMPR
jgi:alkylation response protein AidB-like acyl-CoA dehydrogenase